MMHRIVSNSERMESFVVRENMLNDDHRCGAFYNVSDAKVRMIKIIVNQDVSLCVYIFVLFYWLCGSFIFAILGASRWGDKCFLK